MPAAFMRALEPPDGSRRCPACRQVGGTPVLRCARPRLL